MTLHMSTFSRLQSRFGEKLLENRVLCPQQDTAVLQGLMMPADWDTSARGEDFEIYDDFVV